MTLLAKIFNRCNNCQYFYYNEQCNTDEMEINIRLDCMGEIGDKVRLTPFKDNCEGYQERSKGDEQN